MRQPRVIRVPRLTESVLVLKPLCVMASSNVHCNKHLEGSVLVVSGLVYMHPGCLKLCNGCHYPSGAMPRRVISCMQISTWTKRHACRSTSVQKWCAACKSANFSRLPTRTVSEGAAARLLWPYRCLHKGVHRWIFTRVLAIADRHARSSCRCGFVNATISAIPVMGD